MFGLFGQILSRSSIIGLFFNVDSFFSGNLQEKPNNFNVSIETCTMQYSFTMVINNIEVKVFVSWEELYNIKLSIATGDK